MTNSTPITQHPALSRHLGLDLRVKRDDLFPCSGGGNKARKIGCIIDGAAQARHNAVITNGGAQSNHARVVALRAAELGWPCTLVLHGLGSERLLRTGNLRIMELCGARLVDAPADQISAAISSAEKEYQRGGLTPMVIPGGGHCLQGSLAYYHAGREAMAQCHEERWMPDCVIVPSGTGTTQAGLAAAFAENSPPINVIGISVARNNPRGSAVVQESFDQLVSALDRGTGAHAAPITFHDDFTAGGYEKSNPEIWAMINLAAKSGLLLDPTYTGKAFWGLSRMVRENRLPRDSRVLFWHTGGLLNLLASDASQE